MFVSFCQLLLLDSNQIDMLPLLIPLFVHVAALATSDHLIDQDAIVPEMWGPGVFSTSLDEFGGALTPDGNEFYFSISVPRFFKEVICYSRFHDGHWAKPEVAPWSGKGHEFDPCLSPDGQKLFYVSDRPIANEKKRDYDIWMLERKGAGWGPPIHLPEPINSSGSEHFASCASNGDLYICSDRDGVSSKVYRVPWTNGHYGAAEPLPPEINGEGSWTLESSISPDGNILVSAIIGRQDSLGLYDIYISFKEGEKWTPMQNLGPEINSAARDYTPRISTDGKWLFYTSERGFSTGRRTVPFNYDELNKGQGSILNGYGNIYRVELAQVLRKFKH